MTCHFNDFKPEPHVKSFGPNSKFLTNRIALFRFQIGPGPSCKHGPHSHIRGKRSPNVRMRGKVLAERDVEGFRV
jgi:hypothetical protein